MRFFGWITALAVLVVALVAGAIGYNIGIGTNIAASGTAVAPAVYPYYGFGFGFGHIFGFFFFIIILIFIFSLIRRAVWGGRRGYGPGWGAGWGGYGHHGYWKYGPPSQPGQEAGAEFERWHRRAHGEPEDQPTDPITGRPTTPNQPPTSK